MRIVEFPLVFIRERVAAASVIGCVTVLFLLSSYTSNISARLQVEPMEKHAQPTLRQAQLDRLPLLFLGSCCQECHGESQ